MARRLLLIATLASRNGRGAAQMMGLASRYGERLDAGLSSWMRHERTNCYAGAGARDLELVAGHSCCLVFSVSSCVDKVIHPLPS